MDRGRKFLASRTGRWWLSSPSSSASQYLQSEHGRRFLSGFAGQAWLRGPGRSWFDTDPGRAFLADPDGGPKLWLIKTPEMAKNGATIPAVDPGGYAWLDTPSGYNWLAGAGRQWLTSPGGMRWLSSPDSQTWLGQVEAGIPWVASEQGRRWLDLADAGWAHLRTNAGVRFLERAEFSWPWLSSSGGEMWLTRDSWGAGWACDTGAGNEWIMSPAGTEFLASGRSESFKRTAAFKRWLLGAGRAWRELPDGEAWCRSPEGREILGDAGADEAPTPAPAGKGPSSAARRFFAKARNREAVGAVPDAS